MGPFSNGFRDGYIVVHPKRKHLFDSLCKPSLEIWKTWHQIVHSFLWWAHTPVWPFYLFMVKFCYLREKGMACDKGQKATDSHLTGREVEERKVMPPRKWKCERTDLCASRPPSKKKKLPARRGHRCLGACSRTDCSDVCIRGPEFMRVFPQKELPHYFFMITPLHCCVALVPTPFRSPWMGRNTRNKNRLCILWPFTIMQSSSGPFQEESILTANEAAAVVTFSPLPSITALQTNHSIQLDLFEHIIRQAFFFLPAALLWAFCFFFFFCINGLKWHIPNNIDTLWSVSSNTTPNLKSHIWDFKKKSLGGDMQRRTNGVKVKNTSLCSLYLFWYACWDKWLPRTSSAAF